MKKNYILRSLTASIILILTAAVGFAQTNPWHVVVSEDGKEVASHSTQIISGMGVTAKDVVIVLDGGKEFSYPITSIFSFEARAGNGTAIEVVEALPWNVYYANGSLHFSEPVNGVAIYSVTGSLAAKFTGSYTSVPVNLGQGIYVVQADGKNAKLLVAKNGFGGAVVQSKVEEPKVSYAAGSPVNFRAGGGFNVYWNITAGGTTIPVEMLNVEKFYFTANNSIVFVLKSGNTVELANYQGVAFSIEPAADNSKWDWEKILKYCGANYDIYGNIYFSIADKNAFVIYNKTANKTVSFPINKIDRNILENPAKLLPYWITVTGPGHIGVIDLEDDEDWAKYGVVYPAFDIFGNHGFVLIDFENPAFSFTPLVYFNFNNKETVIKTTFLSNSDGSITIQCANGKGSYTFK